MGEFPLNFPAFPVSVSPCFSWRRDTTRMDHRAALLATLAQLLAFLQRHLTVLRTWRTWMAGATGRHHPNDR